MNNTHILRVQLSWLLCQHVPVFLSACLPTLFNARLGCSMLALTPGPHSHCSVLVLIFTFALRLKTSSALIHAQFRHWALGFMLAPAYHIIGRLASACRLDSFFVSLLQSAPCRDSSCTKYHKRVIQKVSQRFSCDLQVF